MLSIKKQKELSKIYRTYYQLLFGIAFKRLGDLHIAEDIVQDVFVTFNEKYDQVSIAKSWLLGALHIQILKYFKKNQVKQEKTHGLDTYTEILFDKTEQQLELTFILNEVLEQEAELNREIFELKNIYGYSLTKIAENFKMTRRQVRYRYENVAKSLLEKLKNKGISEIGDVYEK